MNGRPTNGVLRTLMLIGVLVALYVAATVWKVQKQTVIQQEEILRTLHIYDSLATIRLLKVAKQAHPGKKFSVQPIDSETVKATLEENDSIEKAKK